MELKENEYLLLYMDGEGDDKSKRLTEQYCMENGRLRKFSRGSIVAVKGKGKEPGVTVFPRNDEQVCAFDLVQDNTKTVKLLTGTWGSGKTMIMVDAALADVLDD